MTKPRVLLITARSDMGGGPKQVAEIIQHLKNEIDFFIAAPSDGEFASDFQKYSHSFLKLKKQKISLTSFIRLFFFVRKHRIYIIHSHGFGAGLYSRSLRVLGCKIIHTFHGLHFKTSLKGRLKSRLEKILSSLTNVYICVSKSEQRKALLLGIEALVISNGLSTEVIRKKKKNLNWPPNVIGSLSRLDPHKNVSKAIEIFCEWKATHPNLRLLIGGDGEQREFLEDLVQKSKYSDSISFLGMQETYSFFDKIDLLLSTSLGEGLPYTILEAQGYGVPILASRVDGHIDLLDDQNTFTLSSTPPFPISSLVTTNIKLAKSDESINALKLLYT